MALCGLLALTIGYLAGLRFRVMIILPLEMAGLAAIVTLALLGRLAAGEAFILFSIFTVALQAGYGLALASPLLVRSRTERHRLEA